MYMWGSIELLHEGGEKPAISCTFMYSQPLCRYCFAHLHDVITLALFKSGARETLGEINETLRHASATRTPLIFTANHVFK